VGEVRSGSPAPALGGKNVATALVRKDASREGSQLDVEIRGQRQRGTVVRLPFYKRPREETRR
jgi:glycine cleavage system aminomethyltransferase T